MCALPLVSVRGIADAAWAGAAQGVIRVAPEERLRREQQHHQARVRMLLAELRVGTFQKHMRQSATAVWRRGLAGGCVRWLKARRSVGRAAGRWPPWRKLFLGQSMRRST